MSSIAIGGCAAAVVVLTHENTNLQVPSVKVLGISILASCHVVFKLYIEVPI